MDPLRVVVVGAGRRGKGAWIPVTQALPDTTLVAVCSRGAPRGKEAAEEANVPWFSDVEKMLDELEPNILVTAVRSPDMPDVTLPALERGVSVINETPIAETLEVADRMIETAKRTGAKLEVAENFYRAPEERLKGKMIAEGVFGKIWRTFNDHRTHNYHAVSILRSYIGFDVPIRQVTGWEQAAPVEEHLFRGSPVQEERARHSVIDFLGGALGIHSFSSYTAGSPIRGRIGHYGFYAERGMAVGSELTLLTGSDSSEILQVERTMEEIGGQQVLKSIHAGEWSWENPYEEYGISEGHVALASIMEGVVQAIREDAEPEYGSWNGRVDREVDLAITQSQEAGNIPIELGGKR